MLCGVLVYPIGVGIEIRLELGRLRVVPRLGASRNTHAPDIAVLVEVEVAAPVLGATTAGVAGELEQEVGVALHLRVAESAEQLRVIGAVDVRNAPLVPQNLGFLLSGRASQYESTEHGAQSTEKPRWAT